ncbi:DUF3662 and FHA domain-containing protein [soil metagenome]
MAGPLAAVERFFERLFERPAARLFQARLEPVHLQRNLERAMEEGRRVDGRRTYVPSRYRLSLSPADMVALEAHGSNLSVDLAEALHAHARRRRLLLRARPSVELRASAHVAPGEVVIEVSPGYAQTPFESGDNAAAGVAPPPRVSPRAEDEGTAGIAVTAPIVPNAAVAIQTPGLAGRRVLVRSSTIRIGRALDNDIVLPDDRVSRHHGLISIRHGTLVYADLGSTNGSLLNGSAVTEIALGPTDVLQLGSSSLTIESGS